RHRSGLACLLGRRLVEAGVPLVTVFWNHGIRGQDTHPDDADAYGWDTHNDIFEALKGPLLPRFDLSFSALLEDMRQRGLLETTLVIGMGEFGRAPLVAREATFAGTYPGRKHWGACYSIVLAGAGVAGGRAGRSLFRQHLLYRPRRPTGPRSFAGRGLGLGEPGLDSRTDPGVQTFVRQLRGQGRFPVQGRGKPHKKLAGVRFLRGLRPLRA